MAGRKRHSAEDVVRKVAAGSEDLCTTARSPSTSCSRLLKLTPVASCIDFRVLAGVSESNPSGTPRPRCERTGATSSFPVPKNCPTAHVSLRSRVGGFRDTARCERSPRLRQRLHRRSGPGPAARHPHRCRPRVWTHTAIGSNIKQPELDALRLRRRLPRPAPRPPSRSRLIACGALPTAMISIGARMTRNAVCPRFNRHRGRSAGGWHVD